MGDTAAPRRRGMNPAAPPPMDFKSSHALSRRLVEGLESVIRGKREVLEHLVIGILAGGHVLIEDVPGLGKTTLAKTVARLISRSRKGSAVVFRRIQFIETAVTFSVSDA
jgi:MoxR-like ATPase